jgi:hypothetical protein
MNDSSPGTHDGLEKRHYNEQETGSRLVFPVHDQCFEDSTRATLSHRSPFGSPSVAGLRDEPCVPNPGRSPCAGLPRTPYRMAAVSEGPDSGDTIMNSSVGSGCRVPRTYRLQGQKPKTKADPARP